MANILITGAGSGLGRLTVDALLTAGHTVAGSLRDVDGRNRDVARELTDLGVTVVEIDVTDDTSVENGIATAVSALGHLDVVINNAGLGALGLLESYTTEQVQRVFDVNVFGVHRVTRAALPHFKSRRDGLFITVSSLTARLSLPFQGPYGASKWAAEALTELTRVEVAQHGIETVIVEPGGMPTQFLDKLLTGAEPERTADYGDVEKLPTQFLAAFESTFAANPAQSPHLVADAILDLIARPKGRRPFRTVVDEMGLGALVRPSNQDFEELNGKVYDMFEISHLREVTA